MPAAGVLRDLLRHRWVVLLGVLIALTAGLLAMFRVSFGPLPGLESRQYEVGVASAAVLIDSQSSQAVDLGTAEVKVDVGSLSARAKLLANLLVTRPLRDDIARQAGVSPDRLITQLSSTTEPGAPPPEASDVTVQADDPEANIISLQTSDTVPIITVNAQAPAEKTAGALAASTIGRLQEYLDSVSAANQVPDIRKLVMRPLGEPTATTAPRGPGKRQAVIVFLLLLAVWCGGVLLMARLAKDWWRVAAYEEGVQNPPFSDDPLGLDLPPDPGDEAAGGAPEPPVGERADGEHWLPPLPDSTSRAA
jgi:hypothetical protein